MTALNDLTGAPAPTPAERPRAKVKAVKKSRSQLDHEHLVDLERALEKSLALNERLEKRTDRNELMLELVCEKLGVPLPPKVA